VNTAVTQMDQVVQQNASLVEEATAATESMKEQAASLLQLVSRFKLGGEQGEPKTLQAATPRSAPARKPATSPIKGKAEAAQLDAAFATVALGAPQRASRNGEWKEF
jgi:hypothetical protein